LRHCGIHGLRLPEAKKTRRNAFYSILVGGKIQPIQKKIYVIERRNPEKFSVQTGNVIATRGELENYINNLDAALNSVGDDAQLANVDLQNILQKQQQCIQQLSNISKMLEDTAMNIIRKIGG
jgi:GTP:adenosylcobinamide-phosphate guanylyltransferase